MLQFYFLDGHGRVVAIDYESWNDTYQPLGSTQVREDIMAPLRISTVFTGISIAGDGPWETAIFRNGECIWTRRATSREDALAVHEELVKTMHGEK